jgi:hypothetical protein
MKIKDDDIINKFRDMVAQRYLYHDLKERFPLSTRIDEFVIEEIKNYFLDSIYPEASHRKALEEAFAGLGSYVKSPRKIWGLLGNMSRALFKFGRQFPLALKAGMGGLDAFLGAKNFEAEMVRQAHAMDINDVVDDESFEKVMAKLPKHEIDKFIKDVQQLFKIMTNTTLIQKTIEILDNVVDTMNNKPNVYPKKEIDGILLGKDILVKGHALFSKYDEVTKQQMVDVIYKNEVWNAEQVFKKWA